MDLSSKICGWTFVNLRFVWITLCAGSFGTFTINGRAEVPAVRFTATARYE